MSNFGAIKITLASLIMIAMMSLHGYCLTNDLGQAQPRVVAMMSHRERRTRRILRLPDVEARVGLKQTAIYDGVTKGTFPKPVPLGKRAVGWLEHEIDAWLDARIAERDAESAERNLPLATSKAEAGRQRAWARQRKAAAQGKTAAEKAALEDKWERDRERRRERPEPERDRERHP